MTNQSTAVIQENQVTNQPDAAAQNDYAIINIRKLAALDIVFHGPKLILAEFGFGVWGTAAFSFWLIYKGFFEGSLNLWAILIGSYLLSTAFNYVPLFIYAVKIVRQKSAQEEVTFELANKKRYARMYTVQSLLLMFPLVVPILALYQEQQKQAQA